MKKSRFFSTLTAAAVVAGVTAFGLSASSAADAFSVSVEDDGSISIYETVLGRSTGMDATQRGGAADEARGNAGNARAEAQPTERIPAEARPRIRANRDNQEVEMNIESEDGTRTLRGNEMRMRINQERGGRNRAEGTDDATDSGEINENVPLRAREAIELRTRQGDDGRPSFVLEQGRARAMLQGADFQYDPEAGTVTIVTPSGQERTLNNLPAEALANMRGQKGLTIVGDDATESGEVSDPDATESATSDLEDDSAEDVEETLRVEVNENGDVEYVTEGTRTRRLLGLFRREVPVEVRLNDETGEVRTEARSNSLLGRLLNSLSF